MKIVTAVYDSKYDMVFGMYENEELFSIKCHDIQDKLEPMSPYVYSRFVLLSENEPLEFAKLVFNNELEANLKQANEIYNTFISDMADSLQEENPNTHRLDAEMEAREYWYE